MNPGIVEGDRVVVDKIAYDVRWPFTRNRIVRWGHPERGDIVTFPSPDTQDAKLLIKRLIAIPGDTIELRQNHLWINGVEATYTEISPEEAKSLHLVTSGDGRYFREEILGHSRIVKWTRWMNSSKRELWNYGPETLPEGHYFLMGDNRDNSRDSRKIGSIERDRIIGRAHTISFSFAGPLILNPRLERFFTSMN